MRQPERSTSTSGVSVAHRRLYSSSMDGRRHQVMAVEGVFEGKESEAVRRWHVCG